jgi:hypothetical protein
MMLNRLIIGGLMELWLMFAGLLLLSALVILYLIISGRRLEQRLVNLNRRLVKGSQSCPEVGTAACDWRGCVIIGRCQYSGNDDRNAL